MPLAAISAKRGAGGTPATKAKLEIVTLTSNPVSGFLVVLFVFSFFWFSLLPGQLHVPLDAVCAGKVAALARPPQGLPRGTDSLGPRQTPVHEAVDIRQDFRHGAVQIGGDLLADLRGLVKRLRQRRVLDNRHLMLQGDLADP